MHAVYNYSGFVDLVTEFQSLEYYANPSQNGARDRLSHDQGEHPGKAPTTQAVDDT